MAAALEVLSRSMCTQAIQKNAYIVVAMHMVVVLEAHTRFISMGTVKTNACGAGQDLWVVVQEVHPAGMRNKMGVEMVS